MHCWKAPPEFPLPLPSIDFTEEGIATDVRDVQPENAPCPIEVREDGLAKVTDISFWQLAKAKEIIVTDEGMVTEVRPEEVKAPPPMEVTDEGMITDDRELQYWKAALPIEVREEGLSKVTDDREVHFWKAPPCPSLSRIDFTDEGMVKEVRDVQSAKALPPMVVREEGLANVTEDSDVQPEKIPLGREVREEGMVTVTREVH